MAITREAKSYRLIGSLIEESDNGNTFVAAEIYRSPSGTVYLYGEGIEGWFSEETVEDLGIVPDLLVNIPYSHHMFGYFKRANLDEKSEYVIVRFRCQKTLFQETLASVRKLEGRKYYPDLKCWMVPATEENLEELIDLDFELDRRAWRKYLDSFIAGADRYTLEEIDGDAPCLYTGVECESEYCPMRGVEGVCPL